MCFGREALADRAKATGDTRDRRRNGLGLVVEIIVAPIVTIIILNLRFNPFPRLLAVDVNLIASARGSVRCPSREVSC